MSRTVCYLLVMACASLFAVNDVPIVQKVEGAIRAAEPGWRCIHAGLNAPPSDVASEKLLGADKWEHTSEGRRGEAVDLLLFQVASLPDARIALNSMRKANVPEGWNVQTYSMGDEAYLATFRNDSRYVIHFRKGTIIVRVSSDSLRLAERFARYAEGQIQTS